jgi:hypothetical protein
MTRHDQFSLGFIQFFISQGGLLCKNKKAKMIPAESRRSQRKKALWHGAIPPAATAAPSIRNSASGARMNLHARCFSAKRFGFAGQLGKKLESEGNHRKRKSPSSVT